MLVFFFMSYFDIFKFYCNSNIFLQLVSVILINFYFCKYIIVLHKYFVGIQTNFFTDNEKYFLALVGIMAKYFVSP